MVIFVRLNRMTPKQYIFNLFLILVASCSNSTRHPSSDVLAPPTETNPVENLIVALPIDSTNIPEEISFKGRIDSILKWKDKTGEYIAIRTRTDISESRDEINHFIVKSIDLYSYCFKLDPSTQKYSRTWHIHDFVHNCEFDLKAIYFPRTFQLTDLNHNQIPEIWTMYAISCRSDVSPSEMKIIVYEGNQKYALRGRMKIKIHGESDGGEYVLDKAFQKAHPELIKHAKDLWAEHLYEISVP